VSEFAEILQSMQNLGEAMGSAAEPRAAARRFEVSVHAFERALGGLVPPVGAHKASSAGATAPSARVASYASPATPQAVRAPAGRATYA
jgi:hypothetical protein